MSEEEEENEVNSHLMVDSSVDCETSESLSPEPDVLLRDLNNCIIFRSLANQFHRHSINFDVLESLPVVIRDENVKDNKG